MEAVIEIYEERIYDLECKRAKEVDIQKRKNINIRLSELRWCLSILK